MASIPGTPDAIVGTRADAEQRLIGLATLGAGLVPVSLVYGLILLYRTRAGHPTTRRSRAAVPSPRPSAVVSPSN